MTIEADVEQSTNGDRAASRRLLEFAVVSAGNSAALDEVLNPVARSAAAGSAAALELLLEIVHRLGLARRSISRTTSDTSVVDDAAQATLIKIEHKIETFAGNSSFRTWLHSVARNEALMILRRRHPEPTGTDEPDHQDGSLPPNRFSSVVASRQTIEALVSALPEPYQETLRLQVYDGFDYEQIAEHLGLPIGTVRSRLAKARDLLRPDLSI